MMMSHRYMSKTARLRAWVLSRGTPVPVEECRYRAPGAFKQYSSQRAHAGKTAAKIRGARLADDRRNHSSTVRIKGITRFRL
ncbi:hypothetical protein BN2475_640028 [Paraburkholderia ribeironis]|uniref:Uncharacterized protein n=1 Tax=Paraburkholderia ribeironis TaxID=1247936 RepID=A0A1N7SFY7_9BURK|nr:hypothetical protein BN2475_640028 [Paraburkholderia ribeironis]